MMPDHEPEEDDDEYISWDCDGCYELGDFEFDTDFEDDSEDEP